MRIAIVCQKQVALTGAVASSIPWTVGRPRSGLRLTTGAPASYADALCRIIRLVSTCRRYFESAFGASVFSPSGVLASTYVHANTLFGRTIPGELAFWRVRRVSGLSSRAARRVGGVFGAHPRGQKVGSEDSAHPTVVTGIH